VGLFRPFLAFVSFPSSHRFGHRSPSWSPLLLLFKLSDPLRFHGDTSGPPVSLYGIIPMFSPNGVLGNSPGYSFSLHGMLSTPLSAFFSLSPQCFRRISFFISVLGTFLSVRLPPPPVYDLPPSLCGPNMEPAQLYSLLPQILFHQLVPACPHPSPPLSPSLRFLFLGGFMLIVRM